jgi:hypothetical protein
MSLTPVECQGGCTLVAPLAHAGKGGGQYKMTSAKLRLLRRFQVIDYWMTLCEETGTLRHL